jgi:hypothetical protein
LDAVRQALQAKDIETARNLLRPILKDYPSAEAWYLAARVSGGEQRIKFLQNALDLDPFHAQAQAALDKLQGNSNDVSAQSKHLHITPSPAKQESSVNRKPILIGGIVIVAAAIGIVILAILSRANTTAPLLTTEFTDVNSGLSLFHPQDWVAEAIDLGLGTTIITIADSSQTLEHLRQIDQDSTEGLAPSEFVVLVMGTRTEIDLFTEAGTVNRELVVDLTSSLIDLDAEVSEPQVIQVNGRSAIAVSARGTLFDAFIIMIEYDSRRLVATISIGSRGGIDQIEIMTRAIAETIRYQLP